MAGTDDEQRDRSLATLLEAEDVTLVVGAGVSIATVEKGTHDGDYDEHWGELDVDDWQGPTQASWKGLLLHGIRYLERQPTVRRPRERFQAQAEEPDDLIFAGAGIERELRQAQVWIDWLRCAFGNLEERVSGDGRRLLDAVGALGLPTMTTNYDRLLRLPDGGQHVSWLDQGGILDVMTGRRPGILHIHGDYDVAASVILGRDSYDQLNAASESTGDAARLANLLSTAFSTRTLVFVGCGAGGLNDPHVGPLRTRMTELLEAEHGRHFILCPTNEVAVHRQRGDKLVPLGYGEREELTEFLERWAQKRNAGRPVPDVRPGRTTAFAQRTTLMFTETEISLAAPGSPVVKEQIDWNRALVWPRQQSMERLTRGLVGTSDLFTSRDDYRLLGAHLYWLLGPNIGEALWQQTLTVGSDTYLELAFEAPESVRSLPWEYLYRFEHDDMVLVADKWRLVLRRGARTFKGGRSTRQKPKLDVLCVVANPWQGDSGSSATGVKYFDWSATRAVLDSLDGSRLDVSPLIGEEQLASERTAVNDEATLATLLARACEDRHVRHDVVHLIAHARTVGSVAQLAFPELDGAVTWRNANEVVRDIVGPIGREPPSLVILQLDQAAAETRCAVTAVAGIFAAEFPNVVAVQQRGDLGRLGAFLHRLYTVLAIGATALDEALDEAMTESLKLLNMDSRDRRCPPFGMPVAHVADPTVFAAPGGSSGTPGGRSPNQGTTSTGSSGAGGTGGSGKVAIHDGPEGL